MQCPKVTADCTVKLAGEDYLCPHATAGHDETPACKDGCKLGCCGPCRED